MAGNSGPVLVWDSSADGQDEPGGGRSVDGPRRSRRGAGRRSTETRLVRAALDLFQRRGYASVGTAEILVAASAPRGSLYHHFPGGKAELATAAIDWLAGEMVASADRAFAKKQRAADYFRQTARATAAWIEEQDYAAGPLLSVMTLEAGPNEPQIATAVTEALDRVMASWARLIAGADADDAAFQADTPAGRAAAEQAETVYALLTGAMFLARGRRQPAPLWRASRQVRAILAPLYKGHQP